MTANYPAQAEIKCADPLFQRFLADATRFHVDTPENAAPALRYLAKVESRSEFKTEEGAKKWHRVLSWYGDWRRGHGKTDLGPPAPPFLMGQRAFARGCDRDDNPFSDEEPSETGYEKDKPRAAWAQGFLVAEARAARDAQRP